MEEEGPKEGKGRVSSRERTEEASSSSVSHEDDGGPAGSGAADAAAVVGLYMLPDDSTSLIRRSHRPRVRGLTMDEAIDSVVVLPMLTLRNERPVKGLSIPRPPP